MDAPKERLPLQIFEDATFQRRTWKVERVGWLVIGAIVVAALFGLFGGGWLGRAAVAAADGRLSLEYDRFWRLQSPTALKLEVSPPSADEDRIRVWIAREYIESVNVLQVMPHPARVEAGAGRVVFEFAADDTDAPIGLAFRVEPERAWRLNGAIGLDGGGSVQFQQFIFP